MKTLATMQSIKASLGLLESDAIVFDYDGSFKVLFQRASVTVKISKDGAIGIESGWTTLDETKLEGHVRAYEFLQRFDLTKKEEKPELP